MAIPARAWTWAAVAAGVILAVALALYVPTGDVMLLVMGFAGALLAGAVALVMLRAPTS